MKIKELMVLLLTMVVLIAIGYGVANWLLDDPEEAAQGTTELEKTLAQLSNGNVANGEDYALGDRLPVGNPKKAVEFDPAFSELQWDDLMPADWDPMAAFRGLNIAELQDNDPKAQDALDTMRKAWNNAPVNPKLAGRKVRIPGFAIPVEQSDKGVDELLLVPYFGACIHTPPPPANQIIHVKLTEPQPAVGAMQAYWIWGEITSQKFSSELGDAAYLITASGIQPYED